MSREASPRGADTSAGRSDGQANGAAARPVRFAVVGLGHISQVAVLPAFGRVDGAQLEALVSSDEVKRRELGQRYGVERTVGYEDFDALLAGGEIDAVYVAVPNHLHCDYTVRAARHGVHVLCEKPMAVTERECEQMLRATEDAGVQLMIAYRLHFEAINMEVAELVHRGAIGDPRLFTSTFCQDVKSGDVRLMPIEKGGGSVYDMGVYCINAARYVFAQEPTEISAFSVSGRDARFSECDEMTTAVLRFADDRLASFTSSFGAYDVSAYQVIGTRAELRVEPAYEYSTDTAYTLLGAGEHRERRLDKRDQFAPELIHFVRCIQDGKRPEPDGLEGLADVRIIRAAYQSAREGRPVRLEAVSQPSRPDASQVMSIPGIEKPHEVRASGPRR